MFYLFSSSSWLSSSNFSFCAVSTIEQALCIFPSASVIYWHRKKLLAQRKPYCTHSIVYTKTVKCRYKLLVIVNKYKRYIYIDP